MNGTRDQFLAGSGFTSDKNRHLGPGDVGDFLLKGPHRGAVADQAAIKIAETGNIGNLTPQIPVFDDELALFNRANDAFDDVFGLERFFDEIVGATFHRIDRHGHITMPGHDDHRDIAITC